VTVFGFQHTFTLKLRFVASFPPRGEGIPPTTVPTKHSLNCFR